MSAAGATETEAEAEEDGDEDEDEGDAAGAADKASALLDTAEDTAASSSPCAAMTASGSFETALKSFGSICMPGRLKTDCSRTAAARVARANRTPCTLRLALSTSWALRLLRPVVPLPVSTGDRGERKDM